ncbi:MAG TPA: flagellar basal body L-ring protein FlgH, partial [Acidobacteriaceae bacterium]|nr:flagellar basal body L-ring protein FlgH [Acidobacteriaceae bacterium]
MMMTFSPLMVAACEALLDASGVKTLELEPLPVDVCGLRGAAGVHQRKAKRADWAAPERMTMSRRDGGADIGTERRATGFAGLVLVAMLAAATRTVGQAPIANAKKNTEPAARPLSAGSDPAAASLDSYLSRVRNDNNSVQASNGAIWTDSGRLTRMSTDVRAMRPHDLISVVVSESLAASTDGTVKASRTSNASSSITGLIGTLHAGNALQNLVNQNSAAGLGAQGT